MGIFDHIFGGSGQQPTIQNNALWVTSTTNPYAHTHTQQIGANALYNSQSGWTSAMNPVATFEEQIKELRYILQRTVENYDELQAQYKALQDITKAEESK